MRRLLLCVALTALLGACHSSRGGAGRRDLLAGGGPLRPTTAVTLATGEEYPWALAADATHVYWVSGTALRRVAKAGGAPETIAEVQESPIERLWRTPEDGDLDAWELIVSEDFVYALVSDYEHSDGVWRIPLAGGTPALLVGGLDRPVGFDVDASGVYVTSRGHDVVFRIDR